MKIQTIKLGAPSFDNQKSLQEALQARHSDREFRPEPLSLGHLSGVLWSAYGINRDDGKRTAPSAMALYPIDVYAVLPEGVYLYQPDGHRLDPVASGDCREIAGTQDYVYTAPLNLLYIGNMHRYTGSPLPPEMYRFLAAADAGHLSQNVCLYCASLGLKAVVRAGAREKELMRRLSLDGNHQFILGQTVGY